MCFIHLRNSEARRESSYANIYVYGKKSPALFITMSVNQAGGPPGRLLSIVSTMEAVSELQETRRGSLSGKMFKSTCGRMCIIVTINRFSNWDTVEQAPPIYNKVKMHAYYAVVPLTEEDLASIELNAGQTSSLEGSIRSDVEQALQWGTDVRARRSFSS